MGENRLSLVEYNIDLNKFLLLDQIFIQKTSENVRSSCGWQLEVLEEKNLILVTCFKDFATFFHFNDINMTIEKVS